jgi:hypothetical protein
MLLSKQARLNLFYNKLMLADHCSSYDEAYILLCKILNDVEDEFSGVNYNLTKSLIDGRLYPPMIDSRRVYKEREDLICFRNKANYTFFSEDGAITITTISGEIVVEKKSKNGQRIIL